MLKNQNLYTFKSKYKKFLQNNTNFWIAGRCSKCYC